MIENHRHEYVDPKTTRNEKQAINARTLSIIRSLKPAGRFLDLQAGCWTEIDDAFAKEKVSNALRKSTVPNHLRRRQPFKKKAAPKKKKTTTKKKTTKK